MFAAPAPARGLAARRLPPLLPGTAGRLLLLLALLLWRTCAMTGQVGHGGSPLHHDDYDDDDGPSPAEGHDQDYDGNHTEVAAPLGATLGGPCTNSCSPLNTRCSAATHRCECGDLFPVEVSPSRGCTAPVGLGDQCLYQAACQHWDVHARCTQVEHNAVCQCEPGFHTVAVHKQGRRTFCSEDLVLLTADLPTLLGVATGIALFTGVICFVLRLFVSGRPRDHFANANLAPSHILFSSDTGSEMSLRQLTAGKMALSLCRTGPPRLPLTGRSTSRSGSQRSVSGSLSRGHGGHGGHGGLGHGGLGSSSRAGAARAAAILLMSCGHHVPTHAPVDNKDDDLADEEDVEDEDDNNDDLDDDDCPPPVPTSTPPPLTPVEPKPPASSPLTPPGTAAPAPGTTPGTAPGTASTPASCSASPGGSPTHQAQRARDSLGPGSRRQSTASVHSSASSTKSMGFGMRRYEREREQRLRRQQQQQQQQLQNPLGAGAAPGSAGSAPCPPSSLAGLGALAGLSGLHTPGSACSASGDELGLGGRSSRGASPSPGPSPNPLSPMSTDKLLPALDQLVEDVVWTTQSSSQRQDHMMAGPSGYRPLHLQRAEMRSERARQLQAQHAQLQAAHLHGAPLPRPSRDLHGGAGPSTSSCTSPDGR